MNVKQSRKMGFSSSALVLLGGLAIPTAAFAWGSYGHQQINSAALDQSQGSPIGQCFEQSRDLIVRYGITPDYDWKSVGTKPAEDRNDPLMKAWYRNNAFEHPLHFFEADAYTSTPQNLDSLTALPSNIDYAQVLEAYRNLLAENAAAVAAADPSKKIKDPAHPTNMDIAEHGTAPWRIVQTYDLGVAALKKGDIQMAMLYLGAMGHYVGDMSQPFHATLIYDGRANPPSQGIHHTYEEEILEVAAGPKAKRDGNGVWNSFEATANDVNSTAAQSKNDALKSHEDIVRSVLQLVAGGEGLIDPLLTIFTGECAHYSSATKTYCLATKNSKGKTKAPTVPRSVVRDFMRQQVPGTDLTVLQTAEKRMGESAALLAKLWNMAYEDAGKPALEGCAMEFDRSVPIMNYPIPTYLPADARTKSKPKAE